MLLRLLLFACVSVAAGSGDRLTSLNSSMRRIDLSCAILAPLFVGLVSSLASEQTAVAIIAFWSFGSLMVELTLVRRVYNDITALQHKPRADEAERAREDAARLKAQQDAAARGEPLTLSSVSARVAEGSFSFGTRALEFARAFLMSMRQYRAHPVFRASAAYSLLYLSVLSLGGNMTGWLKLKGVSDVVLAACRGGAALVGVAATFATPVMIRRWGLLHAGVVSIWLQALSLLPVAFAFIYYFSSSTLQLVLVLLFLCLSRFGLWSFDLVETQLMQHAVAPADAGALNGAQESAMNIAQTCTFLLTLIFSSPTTFVVPVWISFLAVLVAALMYTSYAGSTLGHENAFPPLASLDPRNKDYRPPAAQHLRPRSPANHEQWKQAGRLQTQQQQQQPPPPPPPLQSDFEAAPGGAYVPDVNDVYAGTANAPEDGYPIAPSAPPLPPQMAYRYEDD
jgi:iron-regulated transporter 1